MSSCSKAGKEGDIPGPALFPWTSASFPLAEPQRKSYSIGTQCGPESSVPRARLRLWWGEIERA